MPPALLGAMRHIVPLTPLLLALGLGCSGSHDRGDADSDAGTRTDAAVPIDASPDPERDGGECFASDVSPDILCTGERYEPIAIYDEGCFCGQELACETTIDDEGGGIIGYAAIETTAEACGPVCGACMPLDDSCDVPSELFDGSYAVNVSGWMLPSATNDLTPNTCWEAPPEVPDHLTCPDVASGGRAVEGADLCVPADARPGEPVAVSIVAAVGCDTYAAGCRATRTDDGFVVEPLERDCSCPTCGACPPEPMPKVFPCRLPPLEPGTYTIHYGSESAEVTVHGTGTGNDTCLERDF